ncbi:EC14 protein [Colletotrichum higginsianum]|nr:EC14 protein [Colletotrichum higginsianum]
MHFTKLIIAVLLPLLAAADEHHGCRCDTGDEICLSRACNGYTEAGVFFKKPRGHEDTVFSQVKEGYCYAVYNNGQGFFTFHGLGGREWRAQCEEHCGGGSTCL